MCALMYAQWMGNWTIRRSGDDCVGSCGINLFALMWSNTGKIIIFLEICPEKRWGEVEFFFRKKTFCDGKMDTWQYNLHQEQIVHPYLRFIALALGTVMASQGGCGVLKSYLHFH